MAEEKENASFNPRARVGRDVLILAMALFSSGFNPRARVGRDMPFPAGLPASMRFQSTRPRRARRVAIQLGHSGSPSFNPRARVGRDSRTCAQRQSQLCFNPRARVGRDGETLEPKRITNEFQSTRPRRARLAA